MALNTKTVEDDALIEGRLFTVAHRTASIAAAGSALFAFTTGSRSVVYMSRNYGSTVSAFLGELFKNSYTGGTPVVATNRNKSVGGNGPVSHVGAPTATITGTLEASIEAQADTSTGNARAQLPETEQYILEPNTQYVFRITNQGANAGTINFRWTFRELELTI
jgi:hypothetical protein